MELFLFTLVISSISFIFGMKYGIQIQYSYMFAYMELVMQKVVKKYNNLEEMREMAEAASIEFKSLFNEKKLF